MILTNIPAASCRTPTPPIVYVSGNGNGDFNCDGIDDQVQINQALKYVSDHPGFTTVHLKGPFTYTIRDSVYVGSNTILEGDRNAVLKLGDHVKWPIWKGMIEQRSRSGNRGITVRGFEIDGNHDGNRERTRGQGYHNLISLKNSYNIAVYNMYLHDSHGDGLRVEHNVYRNTPTNIKFYNNKAARLGHDALYCIEVSNIDAYNNVITCRTNSALRMVNSNHIKLHNNVINAEPRSGGPGIEIQKRGSRVMNDIKIYDNVIHDSYGPGIWMFGYGSLYPKSSGSNVHIYHNTFYFTGINRNIDWVGGIILNGFDQTLIENNVFDGCYGAAVAHKDGPPNLRAPGTGYTTILRNNIITNTKPHPKAGAGYGVYNKLTGNKFILQNNCLYRNSGGDYKYTGSTADIHADPLYANPARHDYHLKSTAGRWTGSRWTKDAVSSPCIDAGYPGSPYSKEPEDNGNRINIGGYGNTIYASKSNKLLKANSAPKIAEIGARTVTEGKALSFTVKASDADKDPLTYSAANLPAGASFDKKTGLFKWTPKKGQAGKYIPTFKVSDGKVTTSKTATITVVAAAGGSPPVLGVSENRLREKFPNTVFANSQYLDIGKIDGRYRDLVRYDLKAYKDANQISKATLSLYWYFPNKARGKDTVIEIYRPARWNPKTVTWNRRDRATPWKHPGGDWFDRRNVPQGNAPYATITIKANQLPSAGRYYNLDVTGLVKEYVSGKYENTGFLIKARTEDKNYIAFYSSKSGKKNQVPKLTVNYKPAVPAPAIKTYDNRLREASPNKVLRGSFLDMGKISGAGRYRDLIGFDLRAYKNPNTIKKATLSLNWYFPNKARGKDTVVEIYRPVSWNPKTATWNRRDSTTRWKHPGGDWFDRKKVPQGKTPYASTTIRAGQLPTRRYQDLDVTGLIKEYVSKKYENTGFLIKARTEANNYIAFYGSKSGNKNNVPKLTVK